jgi:hypothetical protein
MTDPHDELRLGGLAKIWLVCLVGRPWGGRSTRRSGGRSSSGETVVGRWQLRRIKMQTCSLKTSQSGNIKTANWRISTRRVASHQLMTWKRSVVSDRFLLNDRWRHARRGAGRPDRTLPDPVAPLRRRSRAGCRGREDALGPSYLAWRRLACRRPVLGAACLLESGSSTHSFRGLHLSRKAQRSDLARSSCLWRNHSFKSAHWADFFSSSLTERIGGS